jgi:hypothetical protein
MRRRPYLDMWTTSILTWKSALTLPVTISSNSRENSEVIWIEHMVDVFLLKIALEDVLWNLEKSSGSPGSSHSPSSPLLSKSESTSAALPHHVHYAYTAHASLFCFRTVPCSSFSVFISVYSFISLIFIRVRFVGLPSCRCCTLSASP